MSSDTSAPRRITRWYDGIYFRFGAACLIMLGVVVAVNVFLTANVWIEVAADVEQRRNWNLAEKIALSMQPTLANSYNEEWVLDEFTRHKDFYPSVELFLLDTYGNILVPSASNGRALPIKQVPVGPLVASTQTTLPKLPMRSIDPIHGDQTVFSVSKTICDHKPCYVYITLTSGLFNLLQDKQGQYHVLRYASIIVMAGVGVMAFLSMGLFFYLSGGFREMLSVVRSIEGGDYTRRIGIKGNDEIAEISRAINSMSEAVEQSVEALANTDRQRRELIANISHDLRGPLTVIEGFLETILRKHATLSEEEKQQYLDRIYRNVLQQKQLTSDLFELSKLEAKEKVPNFEAFSILELAYDCVHSHRDKAQEKQIELRIDTTQDPGAVYADISMIDRVLTNLISNAIRYCPEGTEVCIEVCDNDTQVEISVIDNGHGIAKEDAERIFESFYRVEKDRSRVSGGTGLGLAIVKKIMESHNSDITVESVVGEGTQFRFSLFKYSASLESEHAQSVEYEDASEKGVESASDSERNRMHDGNI